MAEKLGKKRAAAKNSKTKPAGLAQKTLFDLFSKRKQEPASEATQESDNASEGKEASGSENIIETLAPATEPEASSSKPSTAPLRKIRKPTQQSTSIKKPHPFFDKFGTEPSTSTLPPESKDEFIEIIDDEVLLVEPKATNTSTYPVPVPSPTPPISQASNSSVDGGSRHDPIIIDASFTHVSLPERSIVETAPGRSILKRVTERSTRKLVAEFSISTPKPAAKPAAKPAYSIFAPRQSKPSVRSSSPTPKNHNALETPFPDSESQHVRGPQSSFPSPSIPFNNRGPVHHTIIEQVSEHLPFYKLDDATATSSDSQHIPFTTSDKDTYLETIPDEHIRLHPSISRLVNACHSQAPSSGTPTPSQKAWTDKWHPTHANEVLGNEMRALYLKDWLNALQIEHSPLKPQAEETKDGKKGKAKDERKRKRPRVVRAIEKKKGRKKQRIDSDDEEGWIVNSDETSEEEFVQSETDDEDDDLPRPIRSRFVRMDSDHDPPPPSPSEPPLNTHTFTDRLTNTILITGPPGCGKTSAVYACAEELGWEVFEVYPGIGKRNAANLDNLIGDVGKNHLVRKTQTRGVEPKTGVEARNAFSALLGKAKPKESVTTEQNEVPIVETIGSGIQPHPPPTDGNSGSYSSSAPLVRQSLILLEEVDILFKEDASFWPAITNFIKSCKRPVICTCNDTSLIPILDLPLQDVLAFQPCPTPVAVSYFQALCCTEGYLVDREYLSHVYESTHMLNLVDLSNVPITSVASRGLPVPDLRRTIHHLQFWCSERSFPRSGLVSRCSSYSNLLDSFEDLADWHWHTTSTNTLDPSLRQSEAQHADLISFADSYLLQSPLDTSEAHCYEPSPDDEIGHPIFNTSRPSNELGLADQDNEIAAAALRLSRGALMADGPRAPSIVYPDTLRTRALFGARVRYQSQIGGVLAAILPLTAPRPEVHLDYEPWIRNMVDSEDREEEQHQRIQGLGRPGRLTRNSSSRSDQDLIRPFLEMFTWQATIWTIPGSFTFGFANFLLFSYISCDLFSSSCSSLPAMMSTNIDAGQKIMSSPHHSTKQSTTNGSSQKESLSRTPIAPLAPLEYLQNQRRGSITDPSLHAATNSVGAKQNHTSQGFRQSEPGPGASTASQQNNASDPRPASPYVFGEASSRSSEGKGQIRNLLHSPSTEPNNNRDDSNETLSGPSKSSMNADEGSAKPKDGDQMDVDKGPNDVEFGQGRREPPHFDYNMRRHSIAVGQDSPPKPSPLHGTKRKMSSDRTSFASVGEEIDPQLVGPGVPSAMDTDSEAPAPKRRGSAVDTQRIAQLSLYDRRNSVDSRGSGPSGVNPAPQQWSWMNERRDSNSSSSMFSSNTGAPYNSAFPGAEPPSGRPPSGISTFVWPTINTQSPNNPPASDIEQNPMSGPSRPFDPNLSQLGIMHPISFSPDRRMSVPDTSNVNATGPSRVLRSRSRPPSRQMRDVDPNNNQPSGSNTTPEEQPSAPSPSGSGKGKDGTPYSRSPELRVSHKLAERKRRKEMKELFDELRDQLPADRGMKASKWEILSKAIDFVAQLKQSHQDMAREIDMMRHELDSVRQGVVPPFQAGGPPPPHVVYGQGPMPGQYAQPPPPPGAGQLPPSGPLDSSASRPGSSQNSFPPGDGPSAPPPPSQNGNRSEAPPPT